jgi:hypothetical protein
MASAGEQRELQEFVMMQKQKVDTQNIIAGITDSECALPMYLHTRTLICMLLMCETQNPQTRCRGAHVRPA